MKIKITKCNAVGPQFTNLLPDSEHEVLGEKFDKYIGRRLKKGKYLAGYWVQGNGEKVVVLLSECEIIDK